VGHKPQEELIASLKQAKSKIKLNSVYFHYKNPDKHYKVIGFVIIEATDEVGVLYQAQYGEDLTFVRPVSAWLEKIEQNGRLIPRFSKI
jgi:hypothetical protein